MEPEAVRIMRETVVLITETAAQFFTSNTRILYLGESLNEAAGFSGYPIFARAFLATCDAVLICAILICTRKTLQAISGGLESGVHDVFSSSSDAHRACHFHERLRLWRLK